MPYTRKPRASKSSPSQPAPPTTTLSPDIAAALAAALEFPAKGIDIRLPAINHKWTASGLAVDGSFHYIAFRDGQPTVEELVELLLDRVPYFCLSRRDRKSYLDKFTADNDLRHMREMLEKARKLLIRNKGALKTVGEPGELILFLLLESVLKAPQMACKMSLKTSQEMPVHGSDGTHLKFDPCSGVLTVYWGESKVHSELSKALDEVCASITHFLTTVDNKTPRERDIDILCDHMNIDDVATREALVKYFDPYEPESLKLHEVYSCFVGFDYSFFSKLASLDKTKVEEEFKKEYLNRIQAACDLFASKIAARNLHSLRYHFFLVPFPSVKSFRSKYYKALGA